MPQPWPAVSADHARTTSDAWFGGVRKRPRAGRLQVLRSVRSWKRTRYAMRWPAGRSVSSMRAVKPVSSRAAGPTTRRASANESVVAYSTTIRAGRSVRLQTVARPAVTSPAEVPLGIPGRAPSEVTTPGARPAHAREPPSPMRPPTACRRKRRLLLQVTGGGNPGKARGLGGVAHARDHAAGRGIDDVPHRVDRDECGHHEAVRERDGGGADAGLHRAARPARLADGGPRAGADVALRHRSVRSGLRGGVAALGGRADFRAAPHAQIEQDRGGG